ncbi:hypothetical protein BESB_072690 [Besnoitia besnoiti]|uniref:Uncharacterized protein n=1 Tax=Besnoitia besnoiti TaxID=94643 RepID=A0A2A9MER2_BESBE|nr:uncharacterized protein BESB_072690 [Besnoitia besnoiti]PFH34117.1 hypothetical protein BESB_072690 [Besnoitia besnoiti]
MFAGFRPSPSPTRPKAPFVCRPLESSSEERRISCHRENAEKRSRSAADVPGAAIDRLSHIQPSPVSPPSRSVCQSPDCVDDFDTDLVPFPERRLSSPGDTSSATDLAAPLPDASACALCGCDQLVIEESQLEEEVSKVCRRYARSLSACACLRSTSSGFHLRTTSSFALSSSPAASVPSSPRRSSFSEFFAPPPPPSSEPLSPASTTDNSSCRPPAADFSPLCQSSLVADAGSHVFPHCDGAEEPLGLEERLPSPQGDRKASAVEETDNARVLLGVCSQLQDARDSAAAHSVPAPAHLLPEPKTYEPEGGVWLSVRFESVSEATTASFVGPHSAVCLTLSVAAASPRSREQALGAADETGVCSIEEAEETTLDSLGSLFAEPETRADEPAPPGYALLSSVPAQAAPTHLAPHLETGCVAPEGISPASFILEDTAGEVEQGIPAPPEVTPLETLVDTDYEGESDEQEDSEEEDIGIGVFFATAADTRGVFTLNESERYQSRAAPQVASMSRTQAAGDVTGTDDPRGEDVGEFVRLDLAFGCKPAATAERQTPDWERDLILRSLVALSASEEGTHASYGHPETEAEREEVKKQDTEEEKVDHVFGAPPSPGSLSFIEHTGQADDTDSSEDVPEEKPESSAGGESNAAELESVAFPCGRDVSSEVDNNSGTDERGFRESRMSCTKAGQADRFARETADPQASRDEAALTFPQEDSSNPSERESPRNSDLQEAAESADAAETRGGSGSDRHVEDSESGSKEAEDSYRDGQSPRQHPGGDSSGREADSSRRDSDQSDTEEDETSSEEETESDETGVITDTEAESSLGESGESSTVGESEESQEESEATSSSGDEEFENEHATSSGRSESERSEEELTAVFACEEEEDYSREAEEVESEDAAGVATGNTDSGNAAENRGHDNDFGLVEKGVGQAASDSAVCEAARGIEPEEGENVLYDSDVSSLFSALLAETKQGPESKENDERAQRTSPSEELEAKSKSSDDASAGRDGVGLTVAEGDATEELETLNELEKDLNEVLDAYDGGYSSFVSLVSSASSAAQPGLHATFSGPLLCVAPSLVDAELTLTSAVDEKEPREVKQAGIADSRDTRNEESDDESLGAVFAFGADNGEDDGVSDVIVDQLRLLAKAAQNQTEDVSEPEETTAAKEDKGIPTEALQRDRREEVESGESDDDQEDTHQCEHEEGDFAPQGLKTDDAAKYTSEEAEEEARFQQTQDDFEGSVASPASEDSAQAGAAENLNIEKAGPRIVAASRAPSRFKSSPTQSTEPLEPPPFFSLFPRQPLWRPRTPALQSIQSSQSFPASSSAAVSCAACAHRVAAAPHSSSVPQSTRSSPAFAPAHSRAFSFPEGQGFSCAPTPKPASNPFLPILSSQRPARFVCPSCSESPSASSRSGEEAEENSFWHGAVQSEESEDPEETVLSLSREGRDSGDQQKAASTEAQGFKPLANATPEPVFVFREATSSPRVIVESDVEADDFEQQEAERADNPVAVSGDVSDEAESDNAVDSEVEEAPESESRPLGESEKVDELRSSYDKEGAALRPVIAERSLVESELADEATADHSESVRPSPSPGSTFFEAVPLFALTPSVSALEDLRYEDVCAERLAEGDRAAERADHSLRAPASDFRSDAGELIPVGALPVPDETRQALTHACPEHFTIYTRSPSEFSRQSSKSLLAPGTALQADPFLVAATHEFASFAPPSLPSSASDSALRTASTDALTQAGEPHATGADASPPETPAGQDELRAPEPLLSTVEAPGEAGAKGGKETEHHKAFLEGIEAEEAEPKPNEFRALAGPVARFPYASQVSCEKVQQSNGAHSEQTERSGVQAEANLLDGEESSRDLCPSFPAADEGHVEDEAKPVSENKSIVDQDSGDGGDVEQPLSPLSVSLGLPASCRGSCAAAFRAASSQADVVDAPNGDTSLNVGGVLEGPRDRPSDCTPGSGQAPENEDPPVPTRSLPERQASLQASPSASAAGEEAAAHQPSVANETAQLPRPPVPRVEELADAQTAPAEVSVETSVLPLDSSVSGPVEVLQACDEDRGAEAAEPEGIAPEAAQLKPDVNCVDTEASPRPEEDSGLRELPTFGVVPSTPLNAAVLAGNAASQADVGPALPHSQILPFSLPLVRVLSPPYCSPPSQSCSPASCFSFSTRKAPVECQDARRAEETADQEGDAKTQASATPQPSEGFRAHSASSREKPVAGSSPSSGAGVTSSPHSSPASPSHIASASLSSSAGNAPAGREPTRFFPPVRGSGGLAKAARGRPSLLPRRLPPPPLELTRVSTNAGDEETPRRASESSPRSCVAESTKEANHSPALLPSHAHKKRVTENERKEGNSRSARVETAKDIGVLEAASSALPKRRPSSSSALSPGVNEPTNSTPRVSSRQPLRRIEPTSVRCRNSAVAAPPTVCGDLRALPSSFSSVSPILSLLLRSIESQGHTPSTGVAGRPCDLAAICEFSKTWPHTGDDSRDTVHRDVSVSACPRFGSSPPSESALAPAPRRREHRTKIKQRKKHPSLEARRPSVARRRHERDIAHHEAGLPSPPPTVFPRKFRAASTPQNVWVSRAEAQRDTPARNQTGACSRIGFTGEGTELARQAESRQISPPSHFIGRAAPASASPSSPLTPDSGGTESREDTVAFRHGEAPRRQTVTVSIQADTGITGATPHISASRLQNTQSARQRRSPFSSAYAAAASSSYGFRANPAARFTGRLYEPAAYCVSATFDPIPSFSKKQSILDELFNTPVASPCSCGKNASSGSSSPRCVAYSHSLPSAGKMLPSAAMPRNPVIVPLSPSEAAEMHKNNPRTGRRPWLCGDTGGNKWRSGPTNGRRWQTPPARPAAAPASGGARRREFLSECCTAFCAPGTGESSSPYTSYAAYTGPSHPAGDRGVPSPVYVSPVSGAPLTRVYYSGEDSAALPAVQRSASCFFAQPTGGARFQSNGSPVPTDAAAGGAGATSGVLRSYVPNSPLAADRGVSPSVPATHVWRSVTPPPRLPSATTACGLANSTSATVPYPVYQPGGGDASASYAASPSGFQALPPADTGGPYAVRGPHVTGGSVDGTGAPAAPYRSQVCPVSTTVTHQPATSSQPESASHTNAAGTWVFHPHGSIVNAASVPSAGPAEVIVSPPPAAASSIVKDDSAQGYASPTNLMSKNTGEFGAVGGERYTVGSESVRTATEAGFQAESQQKDDREGTRPLYPIAAASGRSSPSQANFRGSTPQAPRSPSTPSREPTTSLHPPASGLAPRRTNSRPLTGAGAPNLAGAFSSLAAGGPSPSSLAAASSLPCFRMPSGPLVGSASGSMLRGQLGRQNGEGLRSSFSSRRNSIIAGRDDGSELAGETRGVRTGLSRTSSKEMGGLLDTALPMRPRDSSADSPFEGRFSSRGDSGGDRQASAGESGRDGPARPGFWYRNASTNEAADQDGGKANGILSDPRDHMLNTLNKLAKVQEKLHALQQQVQQQTEELQTYYNSYTTAEAIKNSLETSMADCNVCYTRRSTQLNEVEKRLKVLTAENLTGCSTEELEELAQELEATLYKLTAVQTQREAGVSEFCTDESPRPLLPFSSDCLPDPKTTFIVPEEPAAMVAVDDCVALGEEVDTEMSDILKDLKLAQQMHVAFRKEYRRIQMKVDQEVNVFDVDLRKLTGVERMLEERLRKLFCLTGDTDYADVSDSALQDYFRTVNYAVRRVYRHLALREAGYRVPTFPAADGQKDSPRNGIPQSPTNGPAARGGRTASSVSLRSPKTQDREEVPSFDLFSVVPFRYPRRAPQPVQRRGGGETRSALQCLPLALGSGIPHPASTQTHSSTADIDEQSGVGLSPSYRLVVTPKSGAPGGRPRSPHAPAKEHDLGALRPLRARGSGLASATQRTGQPEIESQRKDSREERVREARPLAREGLLSVVKHAMREEGLEPAYDAGRQDRDGNASSRSGSEGGQRREWRPVYSGDVRVDSALSPSPRSHLRYESASMTPSYGSSVPRRSRQPQDNSDAYGESWLAALPAYISQGSDDHRERSRDSSQDSVIIARSYRGSLGDDAAVAMGRTAESPSGAGNTLLGSPANRSASAHAVSPRPRAVSSQSSKLHAASAFTGEVSEQIVSERQAAPREATLKAETEERARLHQLQEGRARQPAIVARERTHMQALRTLSGGHDGKTSAAADDNRRTHGRRHLPATASAGALPEPPSSVLAAGGESDSGATSDENQKLKRDLLSLIETRLERRPRERRADPRPAPRGTHSADEGENAIARELVRSLHDSLPALPRRAADKENRQAGGRFRASAAGETARFARSGSAEGMRRQFSVKLLRDNSVSSESGTYLHANLIEATSPRGSRNASVSEAITAAEHAALMFRQQATRATGSENNDAATALIRQRNTRSSHSGVSPAFSLALATPGDDASKAMDRKEAKRHSAALDALGQTDEISGLIQLTGRALSMGER